MKHLLVFASYNDGRQDFFNKYMSPRNNEYCNIHNYAYHEITDKLQPFRGNLTWLKFTKVRDMINNRTLKAGDTLVHLDADMCLVKPEIEFLCNKSFTYSIDSGNSHCMGCYSIKINDWSKDMINLILDEDRYRLLNDKPSLHEAFGYTNCFWHEFREQASWYSLAGIKRHSDIPFILLPNFGWHSDPSDAVYSVEELDEHVEILQPKWNVTEMPGESDCRFNINRVDREDVIIRHFAGGQPWRKEWFD
jgi:hypothetical protein